MTRCNIGAWIKRNNVEYPTYRYQVEDLSQCARVKP